MTVFFKTCYQFCIELALIFPSKKIFENVKLLFVKFWVGKLMNLRACCQILTNLAFRIAQFWSYFERQLFGLAFDLKAGLAH